MKTIILIFSLFLFTLQSSAQITLTSSNNMAAGNFNKTAECDTTNISEGNSGANQTWTYSGLIRQDSTTINFVTAGSTPYASQFPTSNLASSIDNTAFSYITTSQGNILVNGYGSVDFVVSYADPQLFMQYPFSYNSSFSDNFAATYTVAGSQTFRTGTTTVSGDAWGTINLPNGSFSNALRVKYTIVTKDSSNSGFPLVVVTTLTSYNWFVAGRKFPVFEIIYSSLTFNGTPFTSIKTVNYDIGSSTIGITSISAETPADYKLSQNYPNPFNPVTNLEFGIPEFGFVSLKIYDMIGKEVATLVNTNLTPGTYKYNFEASGLTSGIYFYTLKAGDFIETKRMNLLK